MATAAVRALAFTALALPLFGCGESSPALPDAADLDGAPVITTADALCRAADGVLVRLHARFEACEPDRADHLDAAGFEALCRAAIEPYLRDRTVELAGADAIAACGDYADAVACADLDPARLGPCAAVLIGRQPLDGPCELDAQCGPAGYCAIGDGCGRCAALAADGAACDRHAGCASGRCGPDGCAAPAARDQACVDDADCAGALRCTAGRCGEAALAEDAPCDLALTACAPAATGRFCLATDELADTGTCRPFAARGDACVGLGERGPWCDFTAFDVCEGGVCVAGAARVDGEPCGPEAGCADGLVCQTDAEGAARCATPLGEGAACSDPAACAAPLGCVAGACQLGPYTGTCPAS